MTKKIKSATIAPAVSEAKARIPSSRLEALAKASLFSPISRRCSTSQSGKLSRSNRRLSRYSRALCKPVQNVDRGLVLIGGPDLQIYDDAQLVLRLRVIRCRLLTDFLMTSSVGPRSGRGFVLLQRGVPDRLLRLQLLETACAALAHDSN